MHRNRLLKRLLQIKRKQIHAHFLYGNYYSNDAKVTIFFSYSGLIETQSSNKNIYNTTHTNVFLIFLKWKKKLRHEHGQVENNEKECVKERDNKRIDIDI